MLTNNMADFIAKNKTKKIIFGERRTPDDKPVMNSSDLDSSDRLLYRFEDGEEFVLLASDSQSAPDYIPDWLIS